MYFTACPLCGPGSIPSWGGVFQEIFPRQITLLQPVLTQRGEKSPLSGTTQPVGIKEEGQSPTMDRQFGIPMKK